MEAPPPPLLTRLDGALVARVLALNPGVRRLNLARNAIAEVTPALARLAPTLASLDVSGNRLTALGEALGALTGLCSLHAAENAMCVWLCVWASCRAPSAERRVRRALCIASHCA